MGLVVELNDMSKDGFLLKLSEYERLAREYIDETFKPPDRMVEQLKLSEFIIWLRRREEKRVESKKRITNLHAIAPTYRR